MASYNADLDPNKMIPRTAYQVLTTKYNTLREALENILGEVGTSAYGHQTRTENIYQIARQALIDA